MGNASNNTHSKSNNPQWFYPTPPGYDPGYGYYYDPSQYAQAPYANRPYQDVSPKVSSERYLKKEFYSEDQANNVRTTLLII